MQPHLLLVDDDTLMRRSLTFGLERAGYRVSSAATAEDALQLARRDAPNLVILDINLPGMDGLRALEHFRELADVPVIFLTARRRELDEILGLELGADDYITKPVTLDVLLAHIKAVLRRLELTNTPTASNTPLTVGDLSLDPTAHTVVVAGRNVELTPREFDLLHTFMLNPGRAIPSEELLATVWGAEFRGQPQVLYVHVRWLREKIEEDAYNPQRILTIHGLGYKLVARGNDVH
ncbi:MAG: response regulator transcription factor [Anaerolineales bacterium]|nr:response regulator transcription factor [Anaerolineales bacterium]